MNSKAPPHHPDVYNSYNAGARVQTEGNDNYISQENKGVPTIHNRTVKADLFKKYK